MRQRFAASAEAVEPLAFDRIYGAWWGRNIASDAKAAFEMSVGRISRRSPAETIAFSSEVGTGSREENASSKNFRASALIQSEPKL